MPEWLVEPERVEAGHYALCLALGSPEPITWDCTLVWGHDRMLSAVDECFIAAIGEMGKQGNPFGGALVWPLPSLAARTDGDQVAVSGS